MDDTKSATEVVEPRVVIAKMIKNEALTSGADGPAKLADAILAALAENGFKVERDV